MSRIVDREQWSEASKRSSAYQTVGAEYKDIPYICRKCRAACVFTGEEQKISFELKKNFIWKRRNLCSPCNAELHQLKAKNQEFQRQWQKGMHELQGEHAFLTSWLAVIESFPLYGSRIGGTMGGRLRHLLAEIGHGSMPNKSFKGTPNGAP